MQKFEFIIYVKDQNRSRDFYKTLLNMIPSLDVPGMTEFHLTENCKLGIMHESGIAKILGDKVPHPSKGKGIPRCEIYLFVDSPQLTLDKALKAGATFISNAKLRDWNHIVAYAADPDGHILAFAKEN